MPLTHFAFIVKGPGYLPSQHTADINSDTFHTRVVGVASLEDAVSVAQNLIASGVQLIELCGGFTEDDAATIRSKTDHKIPVGVVTYSEQQSKELERLFG
jgi:2-keto-3-deoxy-6-phosphogluconate aldolase